MPRLRDSSELWICLNCMNVGPLTAHGRCETCDSDSVAVADTGQWLVARDEVAELERLFPADRENPAPREAGPGEVAIEPPRPSSRRWLRTGSKYF